MPSKNDIYRKFGEVVEAAQLLETELGTILIEQMATDASLFESPDAIEGQTIFDQVNRQTLGAILRKLDKPTTGLDDICDLLEQALQVRNRLNHRFYREHNFKINTDQGRTLMMQDLAEIHTVLLDAYRAVLLTVTGIDIYKTGINNNPEKHLPL